MASQNVLVIRDKVQRYLTDDFLRSVQIDRDGDFTAQYGSARIFIRVYDWAEDRAIVAVTVPLLFEVTPSQELFKYVATHSDDYIFGRLTLVERDEHCDVYFTHSLLGDFLDPEELKSVVGGMLSTAEKLDNELQGQFGGRRFHDDVES